MHLYGGKFKVFAAWASSFGPEHFPVPEQLAASRVKDLAVVGVVAEHILHHDGAFACGSGAHALCQLETIAAKVAQAMPKDRRVTENSGKSPHAMQRQPILNVPSVVLAVIAILALMHFIFWALGEQWQIWSSYALAFIPARLGGEVAIPALPGSQAWTFLTYAFLHADIYHLGSNSLWLLVFSTPLARRWSPWRYLVFLGASAIAGAAAMLVLNWGEFIIVVGASAAVSAALAAAMPIMFAPGFRWGQQLDQNLASLAVLRPQALLQNRNAIGFALVFMVITLVTGASMVMTGTAFLEERNIAWEAHLGGFLAGLLLFYLLDQNPY
jgi:membrane associated rhomboid family serine protease